MKLIILNGPSGVGKSTIAALLHKELSGSVLIDIDELRRTIPNYKERREESLRLSYEYAANAIELNLTEGKEVIVDKCLSYSDTIDLFISKGREVGAEIYEFLLFAEKAIVRKRADERGYKPNSFLTPEKVDELWEKSNKLREERKDAVIINTTNLTLEEIYEIVKKTTGF
jgi:predicted kinase